MTGRMPKALSWLLLLAFIAIAAPVQAQIYSWRDANGNLVVSNIRPPETTNVKSYAVPAATAVRATRYATVERSRMYDDLIVEHARANGIRTDLVRAVMQVESGFNPVARSIKGAMGLMQLMPETAKQYGVANPYNPEENVRGGVKYLRALLDRYDGSEELALAAYNAGPGAVDKHGESVPPYKETRDYVARINKMASRPIEMRNSRIYKVVEIVDGQPVVRYTDRKPTTGSYEVVAR
jgi:soluble lytic murein transglycosylase-like protein